MPNFSSVLPASLITGKSVSDPIRIPTVAALALSPAVTLKPPVATVPELQPIPLSGHPAEFFRLPRRGTTSRAAHAIRTAAPGGFHPSSSTDRTAGLSRASFCQYEGVGLSPGAENPIPGWRCFLSRRRAVYPASPKSPRPSAKPAACCRDVHECIL